jgi:hypothetical protein
VADHPHERVGVVRTIDVWRLPLWRRVAQCWGDVSDDARAFCAELLVVNPTRRLTAAAARSHRWSASRSLTTRA